MSARWPSAGRLAPSPWSRSDASALSTHTSLVARPPPATTGRPAPPAPRRAAEQEPVRRPLGAGRRSAASPPRHDSRRDQRGLAGERRPVLDDVPAGGRPRRGRAGRPRERGAAVERPHEHLTLPAAATRAEQGPPRSRPSRSPHHQVGTDGSRSASPSSSGAAAEKGSSAGFSRAVAPRALTTRTVPRRTHSTRPGRRAGSRGAARAGRTRRVDPAQDDVDRVEPVELRSHSRPRRTTRSSPRTSGTPSRSATTAWSYAVSEWLPGSARRPAGRRPPRRRPAAASCAAPRRTGRPGAATPRGRARAGPGRGPGGSRGRTRARTAPASVARTTHRPVRGSGATSVAVRSRPAGSWRARCPTPPDGVESARRRPGWRSTAAADDALASSRCGPCRSASTASSSSARWTSPRSSPAQCRPGRRTAAVEPPRADGLAGPRVADAASASSRRASRSTRPRSCPVSRPAAVASPARPGSPPARRRARAGAGACAGARWSPLHSVSAAGTGRPPGGTCQARRMIIVTTNDVPGYRVRRSSGRSWGWTVRSANIVGGFTASFRAMAAASCRSTRRSSTSRGTR